MKYIVNFEKSEPERDPFMNPYRIISDFGCDLPEEIIANFGIEVIPTNLHIEGEGTVLSSKLDIYEFYGKLREKKSIKTSAINIETFKKHFGAALEAGYDVLYIAMSSGLSGTYGAAKIAADELSETYPERKIRLIDTKSGSSGEGLAAYLAAIKKEEGATLEENYEYMSDIAKRIGSWFTVDDLFFLKRGGRLSTATAVVGSLFMIKPILTTSHEGKLVAWGKARGKKGAMEELVSRIEEDAINPTDSVITISHSDCMEDAVNLEMMIRAKWDVKEILVTDIGPAFGAHCGPGTIAVFFINKEI